MFLSFLFNCLKKKGRENDAINPAVGYIAYTMREAADPKR